MWCTTGWSQSGLNGEYICDLHTKAYTKVYTLEISQDSLHFTYYEKRKALPDVYFEIKIQRGPSPWKITYSNTTYFFSPRLFKDSEEIALHIIDSSRTDSVTLFQFRKENSSGAVQWEIYYPLQLFRDTGQPSSYTTYYFDTVSNCLTWCPIAAIKFKNGLVPRRKILLYSKDEISAYETEKGISNRLSSRGCCWVKQKTKWKKGIKVSKNKNYLPGEKFKSSWY